MFSPVGDNDRLASCGKDHTVRLWSKRSGAQLFAFREQRCSVGCLAFCHDGSLLATGGEDGSVYIYNMEKLEREASYKLASGEAAAAAAARREGAGGGGYDDEEAALAAALAEEIQGSQLVMLIVEPFPSRGEGHTGAIRRLAWAPRDDHLLSAGEDRVIKVWSIKDRGSLVRALEGHLGPITDLALSPHASAGSSGSGGRRVASASLDGTVRIWDWRSGQCLQVLMGSSAGGGGGAAHRPPPRAPPPAMGTLGA